MWYSSTRLFAFLSLPSLPSIMNRCRTVLYDFNMSCDEVCFTIVVNIKECYHTQLDTSIIMTVINCINFSLSYIYIRVSFRGGRGGEHLPPLGSLAPPWNWQVLCMLREPCPPTKLHIAVLPPLGPNPERNTVYLYNYQLHSTSV